MSAVASCRLTSHGTDENVGYSTVGLRAAQTMHWEGMLVTPHVSGAWQHAFDDVTPGRGTYLRLHRHRFHRLWRAARAKTLRSSMPASTLRSRRNATAGVSYSGQFGDGVTTTP